MIYGMKLFMVCLCSMAMSTLASPKFFEKFDFKRTSQTGDMNRFETELEQNGGSLEKRAVVLDTCQSGYVSSKYCTHRGDLCFGSSGQNVAVRFSNTFKKVPHVMIGLTLVDANKNQNIRVKASVSAKSINGFTINFKPWDDSITYQIGVNWMACP